MQSVNSENLQLIKSQKNSFFKQFTEKLVFTEYGPQMWIRLVAGKNRQNLSAQTLSKLSVNLCIAAGRTADVGPSESPDGIQVKKKKDGWRTTGKSWQGEK